MERIECPLLPLTVGGIFFFIDPASYFQLLKHILTNPSLKFVIFQGGLIMLTRPVRFSIIIMSPWSVLKRLAVHIDNGLNG
ncbi:MAG: hypothetical protein JSV31_09830 [Desulfobacterales bacterium]|nr:MAG: hypothetical protein JSV31_09830 [Desulfobacterales bacterium]